MISHGFYVVTNVLEECITSIFKGICAVYIGGSEANGNGEKEIRAKRTYSYLDPLLL